MLTRQHRVDGALDVAHGPGSEHRPQALLAHAAQNHVGRRRDLAPIQGLPAHELAVDCRFLLEQELADLRGDEGGLSRPRLLEHLPGRNLAPLHLARGLIADLNELAHQPPLEPLTCECAPPLGPLATIDAPPLIAAAPALDAWIVLGLTPFGPALPLTVMEVAPA